MTDGVILPCFHPNGDTPDWKKLASPGILAVFHHTDPLQIGHYRLHFPLGNLFAQTSPDLFLDFFVKGFFPFEFAINQLRDMVTGA